MKIIPKKSSLEEYDSPSTVTHDDKNQNASQSLTPVASWLNPIDIRSVEDYQVLDNELNEMALGDFLSNLGIDQAELPCASLLKLFSQELSRCSALKWSRVDHALEKLLQWPLLYSQDLGTHGKSGHCMRVRPSERSILLRKTWGLIKVYAIKGFTNGLELGIFTSVHIFIYAMLLYRLSLLLRTGQINLDNFLSSFSGSNQKGIDSLVRLLAHVEARWLRLILASPLIIGAIQGIVGMWSAKPISLKKLISKIDQHLTHNSCLHDGLYESLPGISNSSQLSLSGKLSRLQTAIRWDGRLTPTERRDSFEAIGRIAQHGKKFSRLHAMQFLAKIAHGVGFKDLERLKAAGYSKEELAVVLYTKGKALEMLELVSADDKTLSSLPLRMYRQYLLWWLLGLKTDIWQQQLPAILLKALKLTIELYFIQIILFSILEAIRCPDKPGFELGFGYSQYAFV